MKARRADRRAGTDGLQGKERREEERRNRRRDVVERRKSTKGRASAHVVDNRPNMVKSCDGKKRAICG